MKVDAIIQQRIRDLPRQYNMIEPSGNFTARVMRSVSALESRNRTQMAATMLVPFILNVAWLMVRHDYFSVSSLPLAQYIIPLYITLISPIVTYILLAAGIAGGWFTLRLRRQTI